MTIKSLVCLFIAGQLLACTQFAFGHPIGGHTARGVALATPPAGAPDHPAQSLNTVNLDLSSVEKSLSASALPLANTLNILVGNELQTVNLASQLTPSEFLAAYQVVSAGNQTLRLSAQGNATGGSFSIPNSISSDIGNLVVPQGVKLLDNVALSPTLNLSGNLIDAGKILVFSTTAQANNASFAASNICVQQGGVFTSIAAQHASTVSLTLNALNNIMNYGTISSSGDLSLNAVGSIANNSQAVSPAKVTAVNNVNLYSSSGTFTNNGIINAQAGNINISSLAADSIALNNTGGTLLAANGAINLRNSNYAGSANTNLIGGDFISQSLNLYGGTGTVNMNVYQVTGLVNTYAGCAHLGANTPNLQMGVFDVTGDPFIFNNGGNLDISWTINLETAQSPLTNLIATAAGNIYSSCPTISIDTSSDGGDVVLAAGVTESDTSGTISLTRSGTGGDIYLTSGQMMDNHLTQNIEGFTTGGGNVTLIAMTDGTNSTNGGHVFLPSNIVINTTGAAGSGSVTILAEAGFGTSPAVSLGGINAGGPGGNIIIKSATANLGNATINDSTGNITGSFDSSVILTGLLSPGSITSGGSLTMQTFGEIDLPASNLGGNTSLTATSIVINGNVQDNGSLAIHTNSLTFGGAITYPYPMTLANIQASTLSIDDNFDDSVGGLTINNRWIGDLSSTSGPLNITANATGNATLTFAQGTQGEAAVIVLESPLAVSLSANGKMVIGSRLSDADRNVQSTINSLSPWSLSAPVLQLSDGAAVAAAGNMGGAADGAYLPGTDLGIHTGVLDLGTSDADCLGIAGNNVTIDNNCTGCNLANGLTISLSSGTTTHAAEIVAFKGSLNIGVEQAGTAINIQTPGASPASYALVLGSTTGVLINTSGQLTIGHSLWLSNYDLIRYGVSHPSGSWTIEASTINLNDGVSINTELTSPGLTIHTNTLNLGDGLNDSSVSLSGAGLVIDDNLSGSTGALEITTQDRTYDYLSATKTPISISSTAAEPGNFELASASGDGSTITFSSPQSVNLTATALTIGQGMTVISNGTLNITSNCDIQLASLINNNGSINVTNQNTGSGNITVLPNSQLIAANGNIVINNENTTNGSISLGSDIFASAASIAKGQGFVHLIMGGTTNVAGSVPASVTRTITGGGQVLFGINGIQAAAPSNNIIANGGQVEFNTGTLPSSAISLAGADVIGAGKIPLLQGLDLTNPVTAQLIVSEQSAKLLAGCLVSCQGTAAGGTLQ